MIANNNMTDLYNINIYEKYKELKNSGKIVDNNDLWKIFEWFSCIKLSEKYKRPFYEYCDIDPTFKEDNQMSQNDTGIDCCDLLDTIVQCKLRKDTLTFRDCSTFFASQTIFSEEQQKTIIRWNNMIIARNNECKLSGNLLTQSKKFIDNSFNMPDIINYCENLLLNPPKYPVNNNENFKLRDYQVEAIKIIKDNKKNVIINVPTGCGKNVIIIHSLETDKKYLILVPRIILMEQLKEEIIKHKPEFKNKIQCIGDSNNDYNKDKNICICVYNSVGIIEPYFDTFHKIYIDEAHHIDKPMIYDDEIEEDTLEEEVIEDEKEVIDDDEEVIEDDDEEMLEDEENEIKTEELIDDTEDEIKETTKYNSIIKGLSKYNNNVYLSATIDKIDSFVYYKKDVRDMINLKYLCDYDIHVPIFTDDPTNKIICEHLIKTYKNIIIYCNSQKEGMQVNTLLNTLQKGCSEYIDCKTPKIKRNKIIKKYKDGELQFLVNVRILVEGFDAPITKGICFMHMPSSKTTLIQIIGRSLRLHKLKTIAHIILPFSSKNDEGNINKFLKVMAINDNRIKKSYQSKKLGGYISIEKTMYDYNEKEDKNTELKFNMIFNSLGNLVNNEEYWMKKEEEVKKFMDEYNKRPLITSKNNYEMKLGQWICTQMQNYKNKTNIMSNTCVYEKWTMLTTSKKYGKYLIKRNTWDINFEKVINHVDTNNKKPIHLDKNQETSRLGRWILDQMKRSKMNIEDVSNKVTYKKWQDFITSDKYKKYFMNNTEIWNDNLEKVKNYINLNKRKPNSHDKDIESKKLGTWIETQLNRIKEGEIDKKTETYNKWNDFINSDEYKKYFTNFEEKWGDSLEKVKEFIDINNAKPTKTKTKPKETIRLGEWISKQFEKYNNKEYIAKNKDFYNKWTEFITSDKYKKYFEK
jgi:superfamily II DNA or RNA helicase